MRKLDAGAVYDQFTTEAGPQTIDREKFIKECARLLDPVEAQADLDQILRLRESGRQLKHEIDTVVADN